MKTFLLALILALTGWELMAQVPPRFPLNNSATNSLQHRFPRFPQLGNQPARPAPGAPTAPTAPGMGPGAPIAPNTFQNAPLTTGNSAQDNETIPPGTIDFQGVDINQVLDVYAKLVNRTVIRGTLPDVKVILKTQTLLTRKEAIQALQAVLALNNVSLIDIPGDKFVKAVQSDQANAQGAPIDETSETNIPNLGSYITHIVQLKVVKPSLMVPILQPFARLQNSIFPIDDNGLLVIRDYAENVKRMLEMIKRIDVSVPAEYISEVIPIYYAKVDDIANALNALGSGGGTVASVGQGMSQQKINGFSGGGGMNGMNSMNGMNGGVNGSTGYNPAGTTTGSSFGSTRNGTPSGSSSTFAQRLNNIINKAGGNNQDQIQLFGETKIVPNEGGSSLLVFATRQDMAEIKEIISKLDVPLAQVLIEAVIMDISLGPNTLNVGVSAAQNPTGLGGTVFGGGGYNNGQTFLGGLAATATNSAITNFASQLPGGFSYMANIGQNWDVAVSAAEASSTASVIQRPRIQTSQAQPAQFFVGETVPYVTSSYNYGGLYGNSSSYSQLSVGVELDVTPFINPNGVVTMDIQQEIDDLDGFTAITGVGNVPNTTKRTLNATMTVRDRDTVMLGGFIKTDKSHSQSGVPILSDIPLLGALFSSRSDSHDREELVVLMRPTVLPTPEMAARHTVREERTMPMVSGAAADDSAAERKLIEKERRKELEDATENGTSDGFFNKPQMEDTNEIVLPQDQVPTTSATNVPAALNAEPVGNTSKAQANFEQQARQINSTSSVTPEQEAQLNALLTRYMENQISTEEYEAERAKITGQSK